MAVEVAVIGGGFYGCAIAAHLAGRGRRVAIFERGDGLLTRASYVNQARLHNGYHYPRSFTTAARSAENLKVFRAAFPEAVYDSFQACYAIARHDSKVSQRHFERFARTLGLPLRPAPKAVRALFSARLIEAVYEVEEPALDAVALRDALARQLAAAAVPVHLGAEVTGVAPGPGGRPVIEIAGAAAVAADWVLNCTYAALNRVRGVGGDLGARLKHQLTEVALIEPPAAWAGLGLTVMDGPFFSTMPFPARRLHSLTHVRYTPHTTWRERDRPELDSAKCLRPAPATRVDWMLRDAARYLPSIAQARHVESLFEIKTLLIETEVDDARPILFHRGGEGGRIVSILGGKIDNIFDIFAYLDRELPL